MSSHGKAEKYFQTIHNFNFYIKFVSIFLFALSIFVMGWFADNFYRSRSTEEKIDHMINQLTYRRTLTPKNDPFGDLIEEYKQQLEAASIVEASCFALPKPLMPTLALKSKPLRPDMVLLRTEHQFSVFRMLKRRNFVVVRQ